MYWVSCSMLARSARNAAPPTSIERRRERARGGCGNDRLERREQALAVGLAERNEPHAGRNQVGRDGMQIGVQRGLERDAVARRRDADRDRIGDRPVPGRRQPVERRARPGGARRLDEGAALRGRLQMALLRGRERRRKLGHRRAAPCRRPSSIARCACTKNTASQKPPPSPITTASQRFKRRGILDVAGSRPPIRCRSNRRTRRPDRPATATPSGGRARRAPGQRQSHDRARDDARAAPPAPDRTAPRLARDVAPRPFTISSST